MPERIAHDHPTIETIAATVVRDGPTTRRVVEVDAALDVTDGELVRVVLDGTEYRAQVEADSSGRFRFRNLAKTPSQAKNPTESENRLDEWIADRDISVGRTVHLDVVEPGFRYGLRAPGEEGIYQSGQPDDSLAAIARQVEDEDR